MELCNLSFSYGKQEVFSDLSYTFGQGIYALTGSSGCGKTTLLRLMAGLLRPSGGRILGGGIGNTSVAFQDFRLFPALTALENAAITSTKEKAEAMLSFLGFSKEDMEKFPSELSGGMQERVSLVRALLAEKPLLLLDEPTNALDSGVKEILYPLIKDAGKNATVILVTHDKADIVALGAIEIPLS